MSGGQSVPLLRLARSYGDGPNTDRIPMGVFTVASPAQWHASPRRGAAPHSDSGTGEVRVPLSLFHMDQHQADVELVLSRVEGEQMLTGLRAALAASAESALRARPEAVR